MERIKEKRKMNDDDGAMVMWHTHYPISVVVHFGFDFATNSLRGVQVATIMGFPVTQIKGLKATRRALARGRPMKGIKIKTSAPLSP